MSWYTSDLYESFENLVIRSKYRTFKSDRGFYTIDQLLQIIKNTSINGVESFIKLDKNMPHDFIPIGRQDGAFIDRDYTFYRYSQEFFKQNPNLQNTLIISINGHEAAVAAALAEQGIPTSWNVDIENEYSSAKRIIETLQDYAPILSGYSESNTSNLGIILEPRHRFTDDFVINIDPEKLPDVKFLKQKEICKCIVLTEAVFKAKNRIGCSVIFDYIEKLQAAGIEVEYYGIGDREGQGADFNCPKKTKYINVDSYKTNYKTNTTSNSSPSILPQAALKAALGSGVVKSDVTNTSQNSELIQDNTNGQGLGDDDTEPPQ